MGRGGIELSAGIAAGSKTGFVAGAYLGELEAAQSVLHGWLISGMRVDLLRSDGETAVIGTMVLSPLGFLDWASGKVPYAGP